LPRQIANTVSDRLDRRPRARSGHAHRGRRFTEMLQARSRSGPTGLARAL